MKFFGAVCLTSLFAFNFASAATGIASLDCSVYNRYGQSVIVYDPASGNVNVTTNNVRRVAMRIFFVQDLADSSLRIRLSIPKTTLLYDLDVQMADSAKTPAGSPARFAFATTGVVVNTPQPPPTYPGNTGSGSQNPWPSGTGSQNYPGNGQVMQQAQVPPTPMSAEGICKITLK